ncbi:SDR family NAD(P)-dependent oxidoreductase [Nocardia brevicatena]|uniref:SDR family NAD(P)-dependent oxidoreductase n=1 Tax=Nocardia brevicatena TaxID=37327 RepID=UPI0002EB1604|nr:SDR family NAD(P)-dependent oxidoreductase [Nocardia brevicatena]
MGVVAIFGAGPALGLSVARRFGGAGLPVALVSRTERKLDAYVEILAAEGIRAQAFPADLADPAGVANVVERITRHLGPIEVAYYGPDGLGTSVSSTLDIEPGLLREQLVFTLLSPVAVARAVWPVMAESGTGSLLYALGMASKYPEPMTGSVGMAQAAMRNHLHALHRELAPRGVYAGALLIGDLIERSAAAALVDADPGGLPVDGADGLVMDRVDPDRLAEALWDMHVRRDEVEMEVGSPTLRRKANGLPSAGGGH